MAEFRDWSQRPSSQTHQSQSSIQSLNRKPLSPIRRTEDSAPHHRNISDVSLSSQSQADDTNVLNRAVSAESQQWLPMHGAGLFSPPADGMQGVDLGSPDISQPYGATTSPRQSQKPSTHHQSPPTPSFPSRPKPAPMQFEDSARYYSSPGSSYRSPFSPREYFQRSRAVTGDSQTYLLTPPTASDWTRTPRTPPPYTASLPTLKKWWQWRPAWIMYIFLLFGFCCAVGHHLFYAALDRHIADNQLAMLRYGTILAFAAKAGFVAAVITAFRQRIWVTVRSKLLSVGALDSLFAATDDVSALWNVEIYQKARLAMLLAGVVWLTPLMIILTSNTLLVESVENIDSQAKCPGVKVLNFTGEELEDFRNPTKIDGLFGLSVNYWNATTPNNTAEGWYDYYTGPSDLFRATASLGIFSHQVASAKNAALEICGSGWNCSYIVEFVAPGYKCSEQANGVDSKVKDLGNTKPPFDTDVLLPRGDHSYFVHTSAGDYAQAQLKEVNPGGMPLTGPPWPEHLGAFRTEPVIWAGYVEKVKPNETTPANRTVPGWNESFVPKIFACEHYETAYTVNFTYEGKDQTTKVVDRKFLWPVMNTTYLPGVDANDGTNDNTTATPETGYVYPYPMSNLTNVRCYRRLSAFHSIGFVLRDVINGTLNSASTQTPIAVTKALQTKLLNPKQEWFPYPDLQERVQDLYEDIILSMFSNHLLLSITWAAKPWEITGDTAGDDSTLWPCTRTRWENRYKYIARDLWIVYSCAFLCAVTAVVLGTGAVLANEGRLYDTRFSSIVAATRGPALEKVMWKEDRGEIPSGVRHLKVGYGLIHRPTALGAVPEDTRYQSRGMSEEGETPRFGFGLEGDVRQIRSEGSLFRGRA
ncbi:hypothetical protein SCUP234_01837 [Seiridium cupressi]